MKTIVKQNPQNCLAEADRKGWNWDFFRENNQQGYKNCIKQGLCEQDYECAYTGLWLGENTKIKIHIDHFRKKSLYPEQTFIWSNLFIAAKGINCGADYKDNQIHGPKTTADTLYSLFWSPLYPEIEKSLWYRQDGIVEPYPKLNEEERITAEKTIEYFNLNDSLLVGKRRGIIVQIRDMKDLDNDTIRKSFSGRGFSFLIEQELQFREPFQKVASSSNLAAL